MTSRIAWLAVVGSLVASQADAGEVTIGSRTLVVPEGFEVELAAGPPLVDRPIAVARDELGRLYVTDSAGMSDRADKQLELKPHRIVRLEDKDGDGRYDTSVVFADRMMFPEGCLWYDGSLYVAAPPQIWKLTDADGDGKAERREVWFDGTTLTGCGNDLHGPYLGHDGWIYWCKGAFAEQRHTVGKGEKLVTRASHIFRARPDGSGLESVLAGGMDNPVNVAFLSTGERILSCTFFQHPEAGRRDGLIHAIYGGVYGKKHDPIYAHKMTGDVMPVLVHEGAAAPCGLWAGSGSLFGGGFGDQLFACYFNLHKVVRHELVPNGPTYRTQDQDFVSSEHPDFHPTDVFEDADGSLLVVDTGGWYKVCCPTSQLAKPDVLGAIYRIRKKGAAKVEDPLGAKLAWDKVDSGELVRRLADPRVFVQRRATELLRKQGAEAVPALNEAATNHAESAVRQRVVWTLASIDDPTARAVLRTALKDDDLGVRHAAAHVAGLRRDPAALDPLLTLVSGDDAGVARAAAEAIGRIGEPRAVPVLLKAIEQAGSFPPDAAGAPKDDARRIVEHALIYALIEINDTKAIAAALDSPVPAVKRAALVMLDQSEPNALRPEQVIPLLEHPDPVLKNTAGWIVSHRADWGAALVESFRRRLASPPGDDAGRAAFVAQLASLSKSPAIQELLAATLKGSESTAAQGLVLKGMTDAKLTATPAGWLDELAARLPTFEASVLPQAVSTARALPLPKGGHPALKQALVELGRRKGLPAGVRFDALTAAGGIAELDEGLFQELTARVLPEEALELRSAAAGILATAALTEDQKQALLTTMKSVGPLELPRLLPAFEKGGSEGLGLAFVAAIGESAGFKGLRADQLQAVLAKYPLAVQQAGAKLIAQLNASAAEQAAHLTRLLGELPGGDVRRGHEVFVGKKASCVACHTVGYLGGRLGPDLTNLGKVRNERDLLESIVYPSASFVRSYEPVVVELEDGRVITGIIVKESSDELVLATAPTQTVPIARRDVSELHPSKVSLMPQGFANLLSKQEIADLIAYLKQK